MFKVKIIYKVVFILIICVCCKNQTSYNSEYSKKESIEKVVIEKKDYSQIEQKKDTAYIKNDLLYVVIDNKTNSYTNLVKYSGALDTSIKCLEDSFLISYEYLGSSTKMVSTYKFSYKDPLTIIYKETTKLNRLGAASNIVFFDNKFQKLDFDVLEGLYEDAKFDFIDAGNQKIRIYLKDSFVGHIEVAKLSNNYFIDNPTIHDFNTLKYENIVKLSLLNDIAYFLEKKGDYRNSIAILEKVIVEDLNRTVAYINLGDAYWGIKEQEKAKRAYNTYIRQMKEKGKESKIPQRIYKRIIKK